MNVIILKNVNKIYNQRSQPIHALKNVDLAIGQGEFTAIVGPSGSGKTTLLNIIGGIDRPNSGSVILNQTETTALSDKALGRMRLKSIGFVFQDFSLLPVLTAAENIDLILKLQQRKKEERQKIVRDILKTVGLENRMNHRPAMLSGGEQQRVAVARALAGEPDFVMADEPTANLDTKNAEDLIRLMLDLNRQFNMTFVFSTHDNRVITQARRVITIEDGAVKDDRRCG